jgi:integrase
MTFAEHGGASPAGREWTADGARAEALRLLGAIKAGQDPLAGRDAERKAAEHTVAAVVEQWLQRDQAANRDVARVRRIMHTEVLPALGHLPIEEVRKRDVIALLDKVADRAPIHANRVLAHVRRLFNWAAGRDLIEHSPAAHIEKPSAERARDRVLTDPELVAVWRAAERMGGPFGAGVHLLITTGARREEVFGSSRAELDVGARCLRLPAERTKSGECRTVPLNALALGVVRGLPKFTSGDWLLTINGKRPYRAFSAGKAKLDTKLAGAAGGANTMHIAPWRLHDLRRSVATGLQRLGVGLEVIEAVLGHVSGSRAGIVGVYQRHAFEAEARKALDAWGGHIECLLSPEPVTVVPLRQRVL